ncbi:MAG: MinD/ParA family protein [Lachnospiraceae bacterium]|nr:MinD/ParA family protein [Lachnospiraceae bacterium]
MDQAENLRNIVKQYNQEEKGNARVITVTSGKGGVGKTSVSINLAIQFQKQGKKVIIFDADFGLANIEVMFGAIPKYNLSDLIYRGKNLKDIIVKGPLDIGFVSGGSGIANFGDLSKDQILYLVHKIRELENMADIIIIDTGAGISSTVLDFVVASSEVLLVTTPEPTSITDSYSLLKTMNKHPDYQKEHMVVKVIANKVASYEEGINLYNKLDVVVSKFLKTNLEFLGIIENDGNMSKSVIQQKPISITYPDSAAVRDIVQLSEILLERKESFEWEKSGLAYMFAGMLKKTVRR